MDFRKVIQTGTTIILCCIVFGLDSCNNKNGNDLVIVDKTLIDSLNTQVDVYTKATQEQREMLFRILKELDGVADTAFALGRERQLIGQVKNVSMVDHIKYRLATIKTELNDAEKKMMDNPSLKETIDNYREKIKTQEEYIQHLRKKITIKKSDLKKRYEDLEETRANLNKRIQESNEASITLENENNNLSEAIKSAWLSSGEKLEVSADEVQLLKNSGPLAKKTREAKKRILKRAIDNYKEAAKLGDTSANQRISRVESKIQNLNN